MNLVNIIESLVAARTHEEDVLYVLHDKMDHLLKAGEFEVVRQVLVDLAKSDLPVVYLVGGLCTTCAEPTQVAFEEERQDLADIICDKAPDDIPDILCGLGVRY